MTRKCGFCGGIPNGDGTCSDTPDERSGVLQGTDPVDPAMIEPFLTEMRERVIPEIIRTMEARAEARWASIYGTEKTMHNAWRKRAQEAEATLQTLGNIHQAKKTRRAGKPYG